VLTKDEISTLIKVATESRPKSFTVRSKHKIGASVLTVDGEYFGGCLIESVITGLGVCAERSAIDHAVIHGKYQIKAICVVDFKQVHPCGACLQYLTQFYQISNKDIDVVISDIHGVHKITSLKQLLPHGYVTKKHLVYLKRYQG
jgi:cytidine deaminase